MRFTQYTKYPLALVLLSKRHNPTGYFSACVDFLQCPEHRLDTGYSRPLQREAWATGSELAGVRFLLSPNMQMELDTICASIEGSSLDVERKHNQDKTSERRKVVTTSKASRDSIIRRWRTEAREYQEAHGDGSAKAKKMARRMKHSSVRSLALKHRPDLFVQAKGRLWWQEGHQAAELRPNVNQWEREQELQRFIAEHADELQGELAALRHGPASEATRASAPPSGLPLSKSEWVR